MKASLQKPLKPSIPRAPEFQLDCFPFIFSNEELEILEKRGHVLMALSEGKKTPSTSEERSFVNFCKGQAMTHSTMETAWMKYLHRHQLEACLLETEELYREYRRTRTQ